MQWTVFYNNYLCFIRIKSLHKKKNKEYVHRGDGALQGRTHGGVLGVQTPPPQIFGFLYGYLFIQFQ